MIQRVQSLYLLVAIIVATVMLFVPLVSVVTADGQRLITFTGLACETNLNEMAGTHPVLITLFVALSIVCPIVSLFLFKNRKKQSLWAAFTIASNTLGMLAVAFTAVQVNDILHASIQPELCSLLAVVNIVAAIMARRGIAHDEALVRAADRIR